MKNSSDSIRRLGGHCLQRSASYSRLRYPERPLALVLQRTYEQQPHLLFLIFAFGEAGLPSIVWVNSRVSGLWSGVGIKLPPDRLVARGESRPSGG